jgi:predicted molibdopterin-dependent oxidoreductase YjgC
VQLKAPKRPVVITVDGRKVTATEGQTLLEVCRAQGKDIPTLCYLETLHPVNACRVCVVELEGARVLAPACSRKVEAGMVIKTDSERVRHSRKMVLEFLASSVDLSIAPDVAQWIKDYGAQPNRYGPEAKPAKAGERDELAPGHHEPGMVGKAATVSQPIKIDNELYVRDYSRCILCYKCVEACGTDHQNTFAITVAGRGFDARIATEYSTPLPDSACVYCGNCVAVCPTGALMPTTEYERRQAGTWDEAKQTVTRTVCPYCGVGCNLELHVQENEIVKVTSPLDHDITEGNLCIKGRFGWSYVQNRPESKAK